MTTFENVVFEVQIKIFFISWKSHGLFLSYSIFHILNHSIKFENRDVVTIIDTLGGIYFRIYLLNRTSFAHETRPTNIYSHGRYLQEIFCMIWRTGFNIQASRPFSIYSPAAISLKSMHLCFLVSLKKFIKTIKNSNYHLLKISRLRYIAILSKS